MIFKYNKYREFLKTSLRERGLKNRGENGRCAEFIQASPSFLSLVVNEKRDLNETQALKACDYFGFDSSERDYFIAIFYAERAGSKALQRYWMEKAEQLREHALNLHTRLEKEKVLSTEEQARFYSSYLYSAVRLLASLPEYNNLQAIALALGVKAEQLKGVVEFLVETGLVVRTGKGLALGPSRTHLQANSDYVGNHHRNWRTLLMASTEKLGKDDLVFTAPITLSRKDFLGLREKFTKMIQEVSSTVAESPAEEFACLHLDWFHVPLSK